MGINGAHSYTHSITGVSIGELYQIGLFRRKQTLQSTGTPCNDINNTPIIDIDASWVYRSSYIAIETRLSWMMNLSIVLAKAGFIVVFICDGPVRHHSKRATVERVGKLKKNAIEGYVKKSQLMKLTSQRSDCHSVEELKIFEKQESILSNRIRSIEKQSQATNIDVGNEFFENIKSACDEINYKHDFGRNITISVVQSLYQADSSLAYRCIQSISDIILCSDSDLAALTGNRCLAIKSFKFSERCKGDKLSLIELYTPTLETLEEVYKSVHIVSESDRIKISKFPIFDNIIDIKIRGLLAVGLGCDVFLPGVKGLGRSILKKYLDSTDNVTFDSVLNFYYKHTYKIKKKKKTTSTNKKKDSNDNLTDDTLVMNNGNNIIDNNNIDITDSDTLAIKNKYFDAMKVYVDAFIYEPSNYFSEGMFDEDALYLTNNKPDQLHVYLQSFANNDKDITIYNSENLLLECNGTGLGKHKFLDFEENHHCLFCNNVLCKYCTNFDNDKSYCADCYLSEVCVISPNVVVQPTARMMQKELQDIGVDTNYDDNVADISDIYEALIEKIDNYVYSPSTLLNEITVPLYSSNYLNTEEVLIRFDLKNGGNFIRHEKLTTANKCDIICLLSDMVQIGSNEKKYVGKVYKILPDIIVQFAERSRIHSGYRLLKRTLRHAIDPEGSSILSSICCLISHNNQTGIHINHKVKASMKQDEYHVKVSFTSTDILSCTCTCKAGSVNKERVLCVHILPVLFQVTLLLFDGLAEHTLVEFANDYNSSIEDTLSNEEKERLKKSIYNLKRASNNLIDIDDSNLLNSISIKELLTCYQVGTQTFKSGPAPPEDTKRLGPIRLLSFSSPQMIAERIIKKNSNKIIRNNVSIAVIDDADTMIDNEIDSSIIIQKIEKENIPYSLIYQLILMVKHHCRNVSNHITTLDECIGYRLLKYRADQDITEIDKKQLNKYKKQLLDAFAKADVQFRNNESDENDEEYLSYKSSTDYYNKTNNNFYNNIETNNNQNNNESNDTLSETLNTNTNITTKILKRVSCCKNGCTSTSSKEPNLKFHNVPGIPENKTNKTSSNKVLETYYRKKFIRKQWMLRLGLSSNDSRKFLYICNKHSLEYQQTEYKWKDNNNEDKLTVRMLKLPIHRDDPPLKTRIQYKKRQPLFTNSLPENKKQKSENNIQYINSKTKIHHYCSYVNCRLNDNDPNIRFCRVPKIPPSLKDNANNHQRLQHSKKIEFRKLFAKRIGINVKDSRKDIRICNKDKIENVRSLVHWTNKNGKKQSTRVSFYLPSESYENIDFNNARNNKGLGIDRFLCNTINNIKDCIQIRGNEHLSWGLSTQQTLGMNDENVHPSVAKAVGIDVHDNNDIKYKIEYKKQTKEEVRVRLNSLDDKTIKGQTGFESITCMISFIIILCNGDIDKIIKTNTKLTWLEEWLVYFEKCYGRGSRRWYDFEQRFGRTGAVLRSIYDNKLAIAIDCRRRWPMYTSMDEDTSLRSEKWNRVYHNKRIVMWDNTSIPIPKPQDPEAQRNTWSAYYAGNVGKGAIFIQLCGWMGTHELWMGAVSDSDYFTNSGILLQQTTYIEQYDASNSGTPWMNILDKGYRVTSAAWRQGGQFVLQPNFAKSDTKFTTTETIRSAAIAQDRGANERAVRLAKLSGELREGRTGNKSIERLSDLWLTWSFECNFIYKPVL